jgi:hypothetical protein
MPTAIFAALVPTTPPPMMTTRAAPAVHPFEVGRADLHGHPPRHLRHRRQERQRAFPVGDRLVGDAGHFAIQQLARLLAVGREVQVGEEQQPFLHARVLGRDGFLDLDDHVGAGPHVVRALDDRRARALVQRVLEARAVARRALDVDLVARVRQRAHARRRQPHAVLVVLNLLGESDDHCSWSPIFQFWDEGKATSVTAALISSGSELLGTQRGQLHYSKLTSSICALCSLPL